MHFLATFGWVLGKIFWLLAFLFLVKLSRIACCEEILTRASNSRVHARSGYILYAIKHIMMLCLIFTQHAMVFPHQSLANEYQEKSWIVAFSIPCEADPTRDYLVAIA